VEADEAIGDLDDTIKDPAKGNAMFADDKDAGQGIIPGKNKDDSLITSANITISTQATKPHHRISRCSSASEFEGEDTDGLDSNDRHDSTQMIA
jgi:hypothetical protein